MSDYGNRKESREVLNDKASAFWMTYAESISQTVARLDWGKVQETAEALISLRKRGGRAFILGLGGSAGNASHMANDLRKLCGIEAYAPTDNVSEFSARINDDGWGRALVGWLEVSQVSSRDAIFVLSVGGGDPQRGVSTELVAAIDLAVAVGAPVLGIVGRTGGHTARMGSPVVVPTVDAGLVTPLAEAFQAVIWHGIVSHPDLAVTSAHWESLDKA